MRNARASAEHREQFEQFEQFEQQVYRVTRAWEWQRRHSRHAWFHAWLGVEVVLVVFGMLSGLTMLAIIAWAAAVVVCACGFGVRRLNARLERKFTPSPTRIAALERELQLSTLGIAVEMPEAPTRRLCRHHKWETARSTVRGLYQQCKRCTARRFLENRYVSEFGKYLPHDEQWLKGGDWTRDWDFDRWVRFTRGAQ